MAHPAHFYIKYLLLSEPEPSDERIGARLKALGVASPTLAEMKAIREGLPMVPDDFAPWNRRDRKSSTWLREQRVFSMFHPDEATQEMWLDILPYPRMREDVDRLILGNVSPGEASYRLGKLKRNISESAIAEYKHYFWNTQIMGAQDWVDYFERDDSKRTKALRDPYSAALNGGAELAMYRVGVEKELDNKKVMLEVQRELYYTFQETKNLPTSTKKVEMLSVLARSMAKIDERIQAGDTAIQQVLKQFEKFKVHTDQKSSTGMLDLAPTGSISQKSRAEITASKEN